MSRFIRQLAPVLLLTPGALWTVWWSSSLQDAGRLRIETRDRATGEIVDARLYLTDLSGAPRTPPGAIGITTA